MRVATIESIINQVLSSMGLPVHYYVEIAVHVMKVLRELDYDVLERTKKLVIDLDEFAEYALPTEFVGLVLVGTPVGNHIRPFPRANRLNTTVLLDDDDNRINWPTTPRSHSYYANFGDEGYYSSFWHNAYGENQGRLFGIGDFDNSNTWEIDDERGVLAVYPSEGWANGCVFFEYLYWDYANVHSVVNEYAASAIEKYAEWQHMKHSKMYSRFDVQAAHAEYKNAYRVLRARMNPLNINDFRRASRRYRRPGVNW